MSHPSNPFSKMNPGDGYRIIPHNMSDLEISLHVGLFIDGEWAEAFQGDPEDGSEEIWCRHMPDTKNRCERTRARLVAEAICRYFNSGGSWEELEQMQSCMKRIMPSGLAVEGWRFFDGYIDTEGSFTTVWTDDNGNAVRWVEGIYIDAGLTLTDLDWELEEEYDEEERSRNRCQAPDQKGITDQTRCSEGADG